ncbi:DUF2690 domain-containing protein [Streptomyces sp. NPDC102283]|uniref:helix-turn-helix domain-containing protein n=1 Tax=Streptomyces sp. NPDC102283 TaxID=3366155 RepID=UPI003820E03F
MTEGKSLPEHMNPDVGRLVGELRRAKVAAGMSLAALAEATPYSKSSWERFLNGSQLPPRGAVEALAVGSGTDGERLLALWEVAESAWSGRSRTARESPRESPRESSRESSRESPRPGPPTEPGNGGTVAEAAEADSVQDRPDRPDRPELPARRRRRRGIIAARVAAGAAVAAVCAAAVLVGLADSGPADGDAAPPGAADVQEPPVKGVEAKCFGTACDGTDAVEMGCGGDAWTAAMTRAGGRFVEVRYSSTCRTAWARIKSARPGDRVRAVRKDGHTYAEVVPDDANRAAYTFMMSAPSPREVKTCWELSTGEQGCTRHGRDRPLPGASPVPS